jgi:hypothetical protein
MKKESENMRKFLSVTITLLMVAAMLSSGALAENGKDHKGGNGAGKGQSQSQATAGSEEKGNPHGQGQLFYKPEASDNGIDADDVGGDENDIADDASGNPDVAPGHIKHDGNENKPDKNPQDGPNHGNAYGRVRNTQEVLASIGLLAGEETAAQLNTLMTAYREAKDTETAKAALAALLDTLTQACTVAATDENGVPTGTQDQLALMDLAKLREKVLANAGNDNGTLLALMHAYEDALRIMNHLEPMYDDPEDTSETGTQTDPGTVPGT